MMRCRHDRLLKNIRKLKAQTILRIKIKVFAVLNTFEIK